MFAKNGIISIILKVKISKKKTGHVIRMYDPSQYFISDLAHSN